MKIVELDDVSKTYRSAFKGSKPALRNVTLSVEQGEAFGFVGQNGAGKSTTIKVLIGAIRADSGSARMMGLPVENHLARQGLGYVPENPYLYGYLTPYEIVSMGARLQGVDVDRVRSHVMSWLERFDIAHVANKPIRGFSKGMTQRTALAHALACQPKLLLLDEPLSGLDPIGRRDVVDILMEYRHSGGTIFFSSHVLHDVERLADRFGLIHKGELKTVQSPAELAGEDETLVVRSMGDSPVEGMQADVAGRWYAKVPASHLWALLKRLELAGHKLIEVKPTLSLEQAFFRYVNESEKMQ